MLRPALPALLLLLPGQLLAQPACGGCWSFLSRSRQVAPAPEALAPAGSATTVPRPLPRSSTLRATKSAWDGVLTEWPPMEGAWPSGSFGMGTTSLSLRNDTAEAVRLELDASEVDLGVVRFYLASSKHPEANRVLMPGAKGDHTLVPGEVIQLRASVPGVAQKITLTAPGRPAASFTHTFHDRRARTLKGQPEVIEHRLFELFAQGSAAVSSPRFDGAPEPRPALSTLSR